MNDRWNSISPFVRCNTINGGSRELKIIRYELLGTIYPYFRTF